MSDRGTMRVVNYLTAAAGLAVLSALADAMLAILAG